MGVTSPWVLVAKWVDRHMRISDDTAPFRAWCYHDALPSGYPPCGSKDRSPHFEEELVSVPVQAQGDAILSRTRELHSTRALQCAAIGFACATAYNSAVAIRENLPGEPLGIGVPLSVPSAILLGWGSAVAAPWSMPLLGLLAATRKPQNGAGNGSGMVCAGLGVAGIVGILLEPNTYRVRTWARSTRRAVVLHLGTCATLVGAGVWRAAAVHPGSAPKTSWSRSAVPVSPTP